MSFYSVPSTYSSLLGADDIPAVMLPSTQSKMIPCTSQLKAVRTSSANPSPGALCLWQIQTGAGAGYLKPGSVYLRGQLTLTLNQAGVGNWRFTGPAPTPANQAVGVGSGVNSASALVSRLTVANGAQQMSQLVNYNVWADLLKSHAVSNDYVVNDSVIYEYTGMVRGVANPATANETTINFCIPLISPVFNSQQAIPLFLLNSPLSVEILFNSIADALAIDGAGNSITNYSIANAEICYEEIVVSPELKASVMQRLQGGAVWKMFLDSVYSLSTSSTQGLSYNIGVGLSSCKGVLALDREPTAGTTCGNFLLNGFSNARFYYDGKLINNFDLNTDATVYAELNRTLHSMFDSNITSSFAKPANLVAVAGITPATDFTSFKFAYGVSSQAVNDYSVAFSGMPVQQIVVQTENAGAANNNNFQFGPAFAGNKNKVFFILYDELMTIDANGVVSLMR